VLIRPPFGPLPGRFCRANTKSWMICSFLWAAIYPLAVKADCVGLWWYVGGLGTGWVLGMLALNFVITHDMNASRQGRREDGQ
jgi:hypothetical protein